MTTTAAAEQRAQPAVPVLPPTSSSARRNELAAFLRACRARITPEAVGLPPGLRRRTPGLRREEVAQLAGVGVTWYTWLEQGRPINASDQVVEAISRTLKLDDAERLHLFRLAEVTPSRSAGTACTPPEVQHILDALNPLPANVTSSMYDLLAWNDSYSALFPGVVNSAYRANSIWCAFSIPDCCNPFVNRDMELPKLVAMLRSEYGKHVGEPVWENFLDELRLVSPLFVELWARQQVAIPTKVQKIFRHAGVGELRMTTTSLHMIAAPDTRIVVYTPDDEQTRERMAWLREHPEVPASEHDHTNMMLGTSRER
jgi:transcriptional regulator with XRE-family HTH domain